MNVVIAIDSFKGSMTSMQAGLSAATGIKRVYKDAHITVRPLADGGEGTVDALVNGCDGRMTQVQVTGPSGHPVVCPYGIVDETHTAIIEMSGAAGITQVSGKESSEHHHLRCRRSHQRCDPERLPAFYCRYRWQCHQ